MSYVVKLSRDECEDIRFALAKVADQLSPQVEGLATGGCVLAAIWRFQALARKVTAYESEVPDDGDDQAERTSAPSASPVESLAGAHVQRSCW